MIRITTPAVYGDGRLRLTDRGHFDAALRRRLRDGPCTVTVTQSSGSVSGKQRGYLWGVVYRAIADYFPDSELEDVHEFCRARFAGTDVTLPSGETVRIAAVSTEELDSGDYARYTDRIRDWAATPIAEGGLALFIRPPDTEE